MTVVATTAVATKKSSNKKKEILEMMRGKSPSLSPKRVLHIVIVVSHDRVDYRS